MLNGILIPGGTGRVGTLHDLAWEILADRTAHVESIVWLTPRGILDGDPLLSVRGDIAEETRR